MYLSWFIPEGREKSLAMTAFEESTFWAHAAIARDPALHEAMEAGYRDAEKG